MLKGAALRRMDMSLLNIGRHHSTEFSTVVECMPFICLYFSRALPPGLKESKEVPSIFFYLMGELFNFSCLAKCSYIPCGCCDVIPPMDLLV